ncbi:hypothetical protein L2E82_11476 [Cichorium intybus]|uniref:Uncharacterized protein n=1 Tax=Cichorium intybus TaxID=13427 RepID=A0ACB9GE15_CICIN|nr:hypothetical protein L2E82_11476 [Cichorium intybus]
MSSLNQNNTTDPSFSHESGFDMNTIVVLAALLSALVGSLVLNSVIQYALRRRRESLEAATGMVAGFEKHSIKKIPVEVFRLGADVPATECSICLGDFVDGEKVRVLPACNHEFHVKCVDKWLVEHKSCPNCRHSVALTPEGDRESVNQGQYDSVVIDFMF